MKKNFLATVVSIATLSAGSLFAVGPDSGGSGTQDYSFILDGGNSISVNRSTSSPKASGSFGGAVISNGYSPVTNTQIEAKWDYNGTMIGISTGSPYLIDLTYVDNVVIGSGAKVTSNETAIIASQDLGSGMKVFGGLRLNQFKASIYSPATSYVYDLDTGTNTGFTIGAAYEVPQIMLRASIQYNSEIKHTKAKEIETVGTNALPAFTPDDMIAPSSMIVKLRSALSPRLLAFFNWRSSQYAKFKVTGENGGSLYDPTSGTDYTLGVALKVNDQMNFVLGTARGQDTDDGSATVSALAPFKGSSANILGASFKVNDNLELNASYSLITFGDAVADIATGAPFADNKGTRMSIGTKISF